MKKVAILLKGAISKKEGRYLIDDNIINNNYINFSCCKTSIQKHIIEANKDVNFDFYICSWSHDLEKELVQLYSPNDSLFLNYNDYKGQILNVFQNYNYYMHPHHVATLSQSLNTKFGIELIEKQNINYDYVIIYRIDLLIWKDIVLSEYDFNKIYFNKHSRDNAAPFSGDYHWMMNMNMLNKFKFTYDSVHSGHPPIAHSFFKSYVLNYMHEELFENAKKLLKNYG